jgi:tetratricopeptide (TPR) repeat protein
LAIENRKSKIVLSREAKMKRRFVTPTLVALIVGLCLPPVFGQVTGSVKGVCKDAQGNSVGGAIVEWYSQETGRKYELKTNSKGEYFSLGISPGKYKVTLIKDGKPLFNFNNVPVTADESTLDFDLKKEQANQAAGQGMTPEQLKKLQEQQEKAQQEGDLVKTLNEKLAAAGQAAQTGDFDTAIATLTAATQMDATRDLLWFKLADAYSSSAPKQTDPGEKTRRYEEAVADYQKAVDLKRQAMQAAPPKPEDTKTLAAYYNNLAQAESKSHKTDDAIKAYGQAAELDPAGSAQYQYNIGAVLTNAGRIDEAIAAFDKAIQLDPNKAEAYYQKGVNLISKASLDKQGKVVPAPGTAEALNKYLELQPNGQFADGAKGMLQYIGSSIETSFGKKKPTTKK